MATYAAYRHIELDKVGYGKKRVLKPPGGGSSDIFGTSGGSNETGGTPARRVKNHQQSNLFLSDEPQMTPSRNQNGKDTYSRLFGALPPTTPASTCKNRMKSNILLSDEVNDNKNEQKDDAQSEASNDCTDGTHNGQNGHSEEIANANPVMNGNAAPIVNGNTQPAPAPAQRQRVPPGGFSSGLW
nr:microtubule-associated protein Jupiter isoform X2 [Halyomorpha halys]